MRDISPQFVRNLSCNYGYFPPKSFDFAQDALRLCSEAV